MTPAETRTWAWALAASLTVHAALLWQARTAEADGGRGTPSPTVTRVRFESTGSAPSAVTSVAEPKPQPPKPKPEKAREKVAVPLPEPKPTETAPVMAAAPTGSQTATTAVAGAVSTAEIRQIYRSELLAHIERRKFYPEVARRRGVTGGVKVEFIVGPGGTLSGLGCSAGPAILNEAACGAVRRSVPLPEPPPDLAFPVSVSFVMEFALK